MRYFSYFTIGLVQTSILLFWLIIFACFAYLPYVYNILPPAKNLTIFTWPGILDPAFLAQFEKKTGIRLTINYYESNQELLNKLQATGGAGYDIIIPSDYTVHQLIQAQLIKKIDRSKLAFYHNLNPALLDLYFDPGNVYSIPFFSSMYGLGVDTRFFDNKLPRPASWQLIFNAQAVPGPVGMTNYPREAIMIAAQYVFGSIDAITSQQAVETLSHLLIQQKKHVYAYTDDRAKELLISHACPVVVAQQADILRAQKEHPYLDFIIPQEGGFMFIESIVIPQATQKDDLIYAFINFLYDPTIMNHHVAMFCFCSPLKSDAQSSCLSLGQKTEFFRPVLSSEAVNTIWINLMTSA